MKILRLFIMKATGTVFPSYLEIYAYALFFFKYKNRIMIIQKYWIIW